MILNYIYFVFRAFQKRNSKGYFFISLAIQFNSDIYIVLKTRFTKLLNQLMLFQRRQSILSLLELIYSGEKYKWIK